MIIIVEGIDRVGKSTLCKKISDELKIPIFKHKGFFDYSKMDNDNETDKMLQLLDLCCLTNSSIIFDRFHISDCVYGIIERNYEKTNAGANRILIENKLKELNAFVILVEPTDVYESSKRHGKDLFVHDTLFSIIFDKSEIQRKKRCKYESFNEMIRYLKEEINKE